MNHFETLVQRAVALHEDTVVDKTHEAIHQLHSGDFEPVKPEEFATSVYASKHLKMLSHYSNDELGKMRLFKVRGKNIGFALKHHPETGKHSELVLVHNNEPGVKGIGDHLMHAAIKAGATHLDHFDVPELSGLYSRHGFKEVHRDAYDPQYDEGGHFASKYGKRDVVYRKREAALSESSDFTGFAKMVLGL